MRLELYSADKQQILQAIERQSGYDAIRRMRNWALWKTGEAWHRSSLAQIIDYGIPLGGYRDASMPVLVAEAQQTQRAIDTLLPDHGALIAMFWCGAEDFTYRQAGIALGLDHKTVKRRLLLGHSLMLRAIHSM